MCARERIHVSLSVWSLDQARLAAEIERYDTLVDSFHVDVMDGHFVNDLLFGPLTVTVLRRLTHKPITAHLMVAEPDRWVSRFVDAGVDALVFHPSAAPDPVATVGAIHRGGAMAGAAVGLPEPTRPVLENLGVFDQLCVMATAIGVKGHPFHEDALERIRQFVDARGESTTPAVYVDGGIRWSSIPRIAAAGADGVVAGSVVADADDPARAVAEIIAMSGRRPCT